MSDPQPIQSAWAVPTPHQVLTFLFAVVFALRESGLFLPGSVGEKCCAAGIFFCGMAGVSAARLYLSPRVQSILNEHDACPHPKPGEVSPPPLPPA
jgi:hypothetical protein